jgi:putative membrane protein
MMMGFGLILLLLFVGLIGVVVIGLVIFAVGRKPDFLKQMSLRQNEQSALEILKARYARGEINQEEYQRLRRDLES